MLSGRLRDRPRCRPYLYRNYDEPFYAADDFCCAARRALGGQSASLHTLMMTLGLAGLMIVSYGFIGSLTGF